MVKEKVIQPLLSAESDFFAIYLGL